MSAINTIKEAISNCIKRFGVTVVSLFGLFLTICIYNPSNEGRFLPFFLFLFIASTFVSVLIHLWAENNENKRLENIAWIISYILIFVGAYLFWRVIDNDTINKGIVLAFFSIFFGVVTAIFMMPALRSKDDIPVWNFTLSFFKHAVVGAVIGTLFFIVSFCILWSIETLFGGDFSASDRVYFSLAAWCFTLISPMITLGRLPQGSELYDRPLNNMTFLEKVLKFMAVPLLLVYVAVLYVYIVSIVVHWQLPDGKVAWMTIVMMTCCVAIEALLYPIRKKENSPINDKIARYLPLLMLPVLILMTIGIIRRFCDYGVTQDRLYLLTLNIWYYVVCMVLAYKKAERLSWIPVSFAIVFMLTSVFPVNYSTVSKKIIHKKVEQLLVDKYNQSLPLNSTSYEDLMKSLPYEDSNYISDRLSYLRNEYGRNSCKDILDDEDFEVVELNNFDNNYSYMDGEIMIPEGSKYMEYVYPTTRLDDEGYLWLFISDVHGGQDSVKFETSSIDFSTRSLDKPISLETENGNYLVIDSFNYRDMWYSGYYFSK